MRCHVDALRASEQFRSSGGICLLPAMEFGTEERKSSGENIPLRPLHCTQQSIRADDQSLRPFRLVAALSLSCQLLVRSRPIAVVDPGRSRSAPVRHVDESVRTCVARPYAPQFECGAIRQQRPTAKGTQEDRGHDTEGVAAGTHDKEAASGEDVTLPMRSGRSLNPRAAARMHVESCGQSTSGCGLAPNGAVGSFSTAAR